MNNPAKSVNPDGTSYGNTEPSHDGNVMEGVETEVRGYGAKGAMSIMDRPRRVIDAGECGARTVVREEIVRPGTKVSEVGGNDLPGIVSNDSSNSVREGFARKTLLIKPLGKGETGRLRVRKKDVVAFFVTANPNVIASQVRQYYVYPPDFYLIGNIIIEDKEIEQASGDLLDDMAA